MAGQGRRGAASPEGPAAPPGGTAPGEPVPLAAIRGLIQQRLAGLFRYPLLARRRGWEGRVLLRLRVGADGRILRVGLAAGSGHAVLDRAALAGARRLPPLPLHRVWARPRPFDMLLPVTYRLDRPPASPDTAPPVEAGGSGERARRKGRRAWPGG